MNDDIATATKEVGQVVVGLCINGNAERLQAELPRLVDCLAGVFNTVAALVLVQIIGFAVCKNQQ